MERQNPSASWSTFLCFGWYLVMKAGANNLIETFHYHIEIFKKTRALSQHEIGGQRYSSLLPIMPAYPRSELEGMIRQWLKVNRDAERSALNWTYTTPAGTWDLAHCRDELREVAMIFEWICGSLACHKPWCWKLEILYDSFDWKTTLLLTGVEHHNAVYPEMPFLPRGTNRLQMKWTSNNLCDVGPLPIIAVLIIGLAINIGFFISFVRFIW
jgi:hypothetical protein